MAGAHLLPAPPLSRMQVTHYVYSSATSAASSSCAARGPHRNRTEAPTSSAGVSPRYGVHVTAAEAEAEKGQKGGIAGG